MQSAATEDQAQKPHVTTGSNGVGESHLPVNAITRRGQRVAEKLLEELADPKTWPKLKSQMITVKMSGWNRANLLWAQQQTGYRAMNPTLSAVLEFFRREDLVRPASQKLLFYDDKPICLIGPSGSGKSLTLKRFLPGITGPIFLVDLANEHAGLKNIGVGDFFEVKWAKASPDTRLKFVPSANLDVSKGELRTIFSHLNMLKLDGHTADKFPSGILSNWVVIVEEAHRVVRDPAFQNFLAEGRKFVRKIIVLASNPQLYGSICTLLKPPSLETLLPEDKKLP